MSNIDKRAREKLQAAAAKAVDNFDPNMFVETRDVLGLLDELEAAQRISSTWRKTAESNREKLEAAEKRIAELSTLQGKPIAWESTTPVYVKFITDDRYQKLRPGYQKWYKPYRCSQCAEPVSQPYKLPDGWVMVPVDATRAMIDAARRVEEDGYDAMHKAMLAAAPQQEVKP